MGNPAGIAWVLMNLGWSLLALGEEERATSLIEESLALARQTGYFWAVPYALNFLGWAAYLRGEHERAATLQEQALALNRQVNYRWGVLRLLASPGCVLQARGECGRAAAYLREGLALGREIGARGLLAEALEGMAWLAATEGQTARAAPSGGAAEALREVLAGQLLRLLPDQRVHAQDRLPVEFDEACLALLVDEAAGVDAETLHHAEATRNGPVREYPHHHMRRTFQT